MSWRGEALALGLGLIAAAYAWTASEPVPVPVPVPVPDLEAATATVHPERARPPGSASRRMQRPASLAGTEPDGELHMNAYGDFIPSPGALRLFDYYLTTLGEIDVADIRALVAADARLFTPDQVDVVLALFDRYIAYREDLQSALAIAPHIPLTDLHAVTLTRQRVHFGDDADILFAEENAVAAQLLASSSRKSRSLP